MPSHDTLFFPTTRAVETIYKLTFIGNFEDETPAHWNYNDIYR